MGPELDPSESRSDRAGTVMQLLLTSVLRGRSVQQRKRAGVGTAALRKLDLLGRVARHKDVFFHTSWANYLAAKPGTMRVVPREDFSEVLRRDYEMMEEMIFDTPPSFDDLLGELETIEKAINSSSQTT